MDFLVWPMLAIGYPIYVSIRTIETGSMYDKRKVATYWIIFYFIYLFEHVFEKLLDRWVPVWSYLKLIFICWIVIPELNGALYLYQNLFHPYLHIFRLPYAVTQFYATCSEWFKKLKKDSYFKLEENGSGTREKLNARKPECNEGDQILEEIQVMECTAKCEAAESNQVENKASSALQVNSKLAIPAIAKLSDTSTSLPVFQTRWTSKKREVTVSSELTLQSYICGKRHWAEDKLCCDLCYLKVSSEIDMIAHLKGKRHLAKLLETFANAGAS